jgi:hypothetical protein
MERFRCLEIIGKMAEHKRKVAEEWKRDIDNKALSGAQENYWLASGAASALAAVLEMIRLGK